MDTTGKDLAEQGRKEQAREERAVIRARKAAQARLAKSAPRKSRKASAPRAPRAPRQDREAYDIDFYNQNS